MQQIKCQHCATKVRDKRAMLTHYRSAHPVFVRTIYGSNDSFFENYLMTRMLFDIVDSPSHSHFSRDDSPAYESPSPAYESPSYESPSYESPSSSDSGSSSFDSGSGGGSFGD